jgi:XTP/dITP diphosphohydrolase
VEIVAATRNRRKVGEIRRILAGSGVAIRTLDEFPGCPEVTEDGATFADNAVKKALAVARHTGRAALADDSGIEVDAIGGEPGVRSARYAGSGASDAANVAKLLEAMRQVPEARRTARFVCALALAGPGGEVRTFAGVVEGRIGREGRGTAGFGYDPIFYPAGHDRTFAEMSEAEKDALSHRGAALRALERHLARHRAADVRGERA